MTSFQDSVLFRYFFFHWLFRDASVKELYQRSAAIAHNKANRHHLLAYLRRWIALTLMMYFAGIMLEQFNTLACVFFTRLQRCAPAPLQKLQWRGFFWVSTSYKRTAAPNKKPATHSMKRADLIKANACFQTITGQLSEAS